MEGRRSGRRHGQYSVVRLPVAKSRQRLAQRERRLSYCIRLAFLERLACETGPWPSGVFLVMPFVDLQFLGGLN